MHINYVTRVEAKKIFNVPFPYLPATFASHIDIHKGPWVAGGSVVRAAINNKSTDGDVDVFFTKKYDAYSFRSHLGEETAPGKNPLYYAERNDPFGLHVAEERIKVQLVVDTRYESLEELFNSFDIHACQMAMDDNTIAFTDEAYNAIDQMKITRVNNRMDAGYMNRLAKYVNRGFTYDLSDVEWIFDKEESYFDIHHY